MNKKHLKLVIKDGLSTIYYEFDSVLNKALALHYVQEMCRTYQLVRPGYKSKKKKK